MGELAEVMPACAQCAAAGEKKGRVTQGERLASGWTPCAIASMTRRNCAFERPIAARKQILQGGRRRMYRDRSWRQPGPHPLHRRASPPTPHYGETPHRIGACSACETSGSQRCRFAQKSGFPGFQERAEQVLKPVHLPVSSRPRIGAKQRARCGDPRPQAHLPGVCRSIAADALANTKT
jgi:hypothetical protein